VPLRRREALTDSPREGEVRIFEKKKQKDEKKGARTATRKEKEGPKDNSIMTYRKAEIIYGDGPEGTHKPGGRSKSFGELRETFVGGYYDLAEGRGKGRVTCLLKKKKRPGAPFKPQGKNGPVDIREMPHDKKKKEPRKRNNP